VQPRWRPPCGVNSMAGGGERACRQAETMQAGKIVAGRQEAACLRQPRCGRRRYPRQVRARAVRGRCGR